MYSINQNMRFKVKPALFAFCLLSGCSAVDMNLQEANCNALMGEDEVLKAVNEYVYDKWGRVFTKESGSFFVQKVGRGYFFHFESNLNSPGAHWSYELDECGRVMAEHLGS